MEVIENQNQKSAARAEEIRADENAVCEVCGKFGAYALGDQFLCADCYQEKGSCCAAEFVKENGE